MRLLNTQLLGYWGNWVRVPLMAFLGLAAIALMTGAIHNPEEKEIDHE